MVLGRIAYVTDMPTRDEAIKMLEQNGGGSPVVGGNGASRSAPAASASAMQSSAPRAAAPAQRSGAEASARPQMVASSPEAHSPPPALRIPSFPELVAP